MAMGNGGTIRTNLGVQGYEVWNNNGTVTPGRFQVPTSASNAAEAYAPPRGESFIPTGRGEDPAEAFLKAWVKQDTPTNPEELGTGVRDLAEQVGFTNVPAAPKQADPGTLNWMSGEVGSHLLGGETTAPERPSGTQVDGWNLS